MSSERCLLLMALVAGLAACAPDAPEQTAFGDQAVDVGTDINVSELEEVNPTVVEPIDGTWLQYSQISTCVDLIRIMELLSRTVFIVRMEVDHDWVVNEEWLACDIELTPILNLPTIVPDRLIESVYPVETSGSFVTGTAIGGSYNSAVLPEQWGIMMDDPINEVFPTEIDDPRIQDTDGDGNPGATVDIGDLCQTYLAQRAMSTFSGVFTAPDHIQGGIVSLTHQITIGASEAFCGTRFETRPNDGRSVFERIRVDGQGGALNLDANDDGEVTFDEVMPYVSQLFEQVVVDDTQCIR